MLDWSIILPYAGLIVLLEIGVFPIVPVALAAGVFLGFTNGLATLTIGLFLSALINFEVTRNAKSCILSRKIESSAKFARLSAAIRNGGWKSVFLLRFCPLPYGLVNYAMGLTGVRLSHFLSATFLATLPISLLLVSIGSKVVSDSGWTTLLMLASLLLFSYAGRYLEKLAGS